MLSAPEANKTVAFMAVGGGGSAALSKILGALLSRGVPEVSRALRIAVERRALASSAPAVVRWSSSR